MHIPLSQIKTNQIIEIVSMTCGRCCKLRLTEIGLRIGLKIKVISKSDNGPLIVATNSARFAVGRGMSNKIIVERKEND